MAEKQSNWIYVAAAWKTKKKGQLSVSFDVDRLQEALDEAPRQERTVSGRTKESIRALLVPPYDDGSGQRRGRNAPDFNIIISRQAPDAGAKNRQRDTRDQDDDLPF